MSPNRTKKRMHTVAVLIRSICYFLYILIWLMLYYKQNNSEEWLFRQNVASDLCAKDVTFVSDQWPLHVRGVWLVDDVTTGILPRGRVRGGGCIWIGIPPHFLLNAITCAGLHVDCLPLVIDVSQNLSVDKFQ